MMLSSINGNRNWTNGGRGFLKSVFVVMSDINIAGIGGSNIGGVEAAPLVTSYIGVASFSVNAIVFLDVLESIIHQTSIAALVAILARAIDKVLLTEGDKIPGLELMLPLQGACGAEGPAGAALALVLDGRHAALGSPVYLIRELRTSCNELRSSVRATAATVAIVNVGKLATVKIPKLVHFQRVAEFVRVFVVHVDVFLVCLPSDVAS